MKKILKTFKILSFIIIPPLIVFIYFFGWGWLVPYELQPSYWQFRNMCKINELPNDEEKYNKILKYFDTDLESLDWEELNERSLKLVKGFNTDYVESKLEYRVKIATIQKKRYNVSVDLYANTKGFSKDNITYIQTYGSWDTKRYFLEQKKYGKL